ncbi:MAG: TonB-dependent receptor, partial [Candidatus Cloacimonetes bacterium]|nr:TonB-dependent receptor [Candidatus Cloacimonadota bacterium]
TNFSFEHNEWELKTELEYLQGRRNDLDIKLEDVFLLNIIFNYNLRKNLHITAEVENLLDENYKEYSNIPCEEIQFNVGIRINL